MNQRREISVCAGTFLAHKSGQGMPQFNLFNGSPLPQVEVHRPGRGPQALLPSWPCLYKSATSVIKMSQAVPSHLQAFPLFQTLSFRPCLHLSSSSSISSSSLSLIISRSLPQSVWGTYMYCHGHAYLLPPQDCSVCAQVCMPF